MNGELPFICNQCGKADCNDYFERKVTTLLLRDQNIIKTDRYDKSWKEMKHAIKFCLQYWEAHNRLHNDRFGMNSVTVSECFLLDMDSIFPKPNNLGDGHPLLALLDDIDDDDITMLNLAIPAHPYHISGVV